METLPELYFLGALKKGVVMQDAISASIFSAVREKTVYISTVFAVDTFLSIYYKLQDAGMGQLPLSTVHRFLRNTSAAINDLSMSLPNNESREALLPTQQHMAHAQNDFLRKLKTIARTGVVSQTPYFSLLRNPVLCGLRLHMERILAQDTALALERRLGGIIAAVHIGNALIKEKLIADLGGLQRTARAQGHSPFFVGAKPPTNKSEYLTAYMLAIGGSVTNLLPAGARTGLSARAGRKEMTIPAPFSRVVKDSLERTTSLTEEQLATMLGESNERLRKVYQPKGKGRHAAPAGAVSPLQHAAMLLHAEAPVLEEDLMADVRLAWDALRAVQDALGGPKDKASRGSSAGPEGQRGVDPSEVIVGRVFAAGTLANEKMMEEVGKAFAGAVFAGYLRKVDDTIW